MPGAAVPPFGQGERPGAGEVEPERGAGRGRGAGHAGEEDVLAAWRVRGGLNAPSGAVPPFRQGGHKPRTADGGAGRRRGAGDAVEDDALTGAAECGHDPPGLAVPGLSERPYRVARTV